MPPPRMPEPRATDPFEEAKADFLEGLSCLEEGRYEDAEQCFLSSLKWQPARVSTLINLAATQLELSRPEDALATADRVLAIENDNIDAWFHRSNALGLLDRNEEALSGLEKVLAIDDGLAEPWFRHGQVLHSLKRPEQALQSYDRALSIDAGLAQAWSNRGGLLQELKRPREAAESFRLAIANGGDRELNEYYLAAAGASSAPPMAPAGYVRSLFDDYAEQFDEHLVKVLHYRAHTALACRLRRLAAERFSSALDLGCGTGLCGPLLKPIAGRLTGVDLSSEMLEKARALGVYDRLLNADIVAHLAASAEVHDLIVAADVFIYVGDLTPIFRDARRVMAQGGVFCFSAEIARSDGATFELLPSLRYAHSEPYLRHLAAVHGFDVIDVVREPLRADQHTAIEGLFVYLRAKSVAVSGAPR